MSAVLEELDLADPTAEMKASVIIASGSRETQTFSTGETTRISEVIGHRHLTVIDVIKALAKRGFETETQNLLNLVKLRISGDYLQTSAIVRNQRVISAVNDPNGYAGPCTGYRLTEARRDEIIAIRDTLGQPEVLDEQARHKKAEAKRIVYLGAEIAHVGEDSTDVVIGISPAFGLQLFQTTRGKDLSSVLKNLIDGVRQGVGHARVVRMYHTADTARTKVVSNGREIEAASGVFSAGIFTKRSAAIAT